MQGRGEGRGSLRTEFRGLHRLAQDAWLVRHSSGSSLSSTPVSSISSQLHWIPGIPLRFWSNWPLSFKVLRCSQNCYRLTRSSSPWSSLPLLFLCLGCGVQALSLPPGHCPPMLTACLFPGQFGIYGFREGKDGTISLPPLPTADSTALDSTNCAANIFRNENCTCTEQVLTSFLVNDILNNTL